MAIQKVFSVYDSKAAVFSAPFLAHNEQVALRMFSAAVNDPQTEIFRFPEDFTIFMLGSFDDNLGTYDLLQPMVSVAVASSFKLVNRE